MKNESHTSERKNSQPALHAARAALNALDPDSAPWPELKAARLAYRRALHAATDKDTPIDYSTKLRPRCLAARTAFEAAQARLAIIENNPDGYSQADYVDAAVAASQAEEHWHLLSLQWDGRLQWELEQRKTDKIDKAAGVRVNNWHGSQFNITRL